MPRKFCFLILCLTISTKLLGFTCQELYHSEDFRHPRNSALRYNSAITVSAASFVVQNIGTTAAILTGNLALLAVALPSTIFSIYNLIDFSFDIKRYNSSKRNDRHVNLIIDQARDLINSDKLASDYPEFNEFCVKEIIKPVSKENKLWARDEPMSDSFLASEYIAEKLLQMNETRDSNLCIVVFAEGTSYSLYHKLEFIAKNIKKALFF